MLTLKLKEVKTNRVYEIEKGAAFDKLAKIRESEGNRKVYGIKFNNEIKELFRKVEDEGEIEFIDLTKVDGVRIYQRGLLFVMFMAMRELGLEDKFYVHHYTGNGLYCEFKSGEPAEEYLDKIAEKMKEIIARDIPFERRTMNKFQAMMMFAETNQDQKALLIKYRNKSTVNVYKAGDFYNYFYGYMPKSTGDVPVFKLQKENGGAVLIHPNEKNPDGLPEFKHFRKLSSTFATYKKWLRIIDIRTVGELNEQIAQGKATTTEVIRVSEVLHEKEYARIADEISKNDQLRLVTIAGPSSSAKTTSAKRLALHLKVNGLKPVAISLDDYYINRVNTPLDEEGNYDFESIYALDLDFFNRQLTDLLSGKEIEMPKYDFVKGERVKSGKHLKINQDDIVIIEGIHGLNEMLTNSVPREHKYKMYVSALTQMNLDDLNRITTTDTRIIRRIVRDFNTRGYDALGTLKMWPNVRKGEEKYIFPFQEEADAMFNSHLIYELAVLKIYAEPLLLKIDNMVPEYTEAKRLLKILDYFLPVTELEEIPRHSVIREFIGRSTFEY